MLLNPLPNHKIFDLSKFKGFADDKINVNFRFDLERDKNIVEKAEDASYQHFLLFPQCFHKLSISRTLKFGIVW